MFRTRLQRHRLIGEGIPAEAGGQGVAARRRSLDCARNAGPRRLRQALHDCPLERVAAARRISGRACGLQPPRASDPILSTAISADIDGFIARQVKHGGGIEDASAGRAASRAYLIEELAAITLQGRAQSSARIYPGPELASFRAVRDGRVAGAPAGLERDYYVHVNLERRKAPAPLPHAARSIAALKSRESFSPRCCCSAASIGSSRRREAGGRVQALRRDGSPRRTLPAVQVRAPEIEVGLHHSRLLLRV